jgi:hypothetical protein
MDVTGRRGGDSFRSWVGIGSNPPQGFELSIRKQERERESWRTDGKRTELGDGTAAGGLTCPSRAAVARDYEQRNDEER